MPSGEGEESMETDPSGTDKVYYVVRECGVVTCPSHLLFRTLCHLFTGSPIVAMRFRQAHVLLRTAACCAALSAKPPEPR
jgi:hypothetical protein